MNNVALPFLAESALVTARAVKKDRRPPLPSELVAVFIIFGGVALLSAWNPTVGQTFGWGVVAATALNVMPMISAPKED